MKVEIKKPQQQSAATFHKMLKQVEDLQNELWEQTNLIADLKQLTVLYAMTLAAFDPTFYELLPVSDERKIAAIAKLADDQRLTEKGDLLERLILEYTDEQHPVSKEVRRSLLADMPLDVMQYGARQCEPPVGKIV